MSQKPNPQQELIPEGPLENRNRRCLESGMISDVFLTALVAGMPQHGTTTLIGCLSGPESHHCRNKQEVGSLNPVFDYCRLPTGERISLFDSTFFCDLGKKMAGVLHEVDLVVLVVAADEGVSPLTGDQLKILASFNVKGGFAVITKADLVDNELIDVARMEIEEVLRASFLEGKPIIAFSDLDRRGLDQIRTAMAVEARLVDRQCSFSKAHFKLLRRKLLDCAVSILSHNVFKVSMTADELFSQLQPTLDQALIKQMLCDLTSEGRLIAMEHGYRVPTMKMRLPGNKAKYADQMLDHIRGLGQATFKARTICELHWKSFDVSEIRELLEYLRRKKKLVLLSDGRYMTSDAIEEISQKVTELILSKGCLRVQDGWEILGCGRNRVIPVFDYLDSIGLTRRVEDFRVLR